jgi:hypothetical protein
MNQATAEHPTEAETPETPAALRLAATAPQTDDDTEGELLDSPEQADLDVLCERWVYWCRTRRQYAPVASLNGILGKLTKSTRPMSRVPHDPLTSAELLAFNLAYLSQPAAIDKQVFEAHYLYRIKPIKVAADALGISRQHYYVLLRAFRQRVHIASKAIVADNERALAALPHAPSHTTSST